MKKELQEGASINFMEVEPRTAHNAQIALEWTGDPIKALWIAEAIESKKNILILGPVGSGKTKLINDLLLMSLPEENFRYIFRSPGEEFTEYDLHSEFHNRVEYSINMNFDKFHVLKKGISPKEQSYWMKPDFYVIDDLNRSDLISTTTRVKKSIELPMISTIQCSNEHDLQFIDMYLKHNFNVFIFLNRYKDVSHVMYLDNNL